MKPARALLSLCLAGIAIAATGPGAAADTELGHRGTVGRHRLRDSEARPGAACVYDGGQVFAGLRVRPPVVFAVDDTAERDRQPVGWRIVLQEREGPDTPWHTVRRSALQVAAAWDDTPAAFSRLGVRFGGHAAHQYRARVRMFWFLDRASRGLQGASVHAVDHYRSPVAESQPLPCSGAIL